MAWPERVLLPVDFSACSQEALGEALDLVRGHAARVFILHVSMGSPSWTVRLIPELEWMSARRELGLLAREARSFRRDEGKFEVETLLRQGVIVTEIVKAAREVRADLILVASHDRRGFSRLIHGSIAQGVAGPAPCPVLVTHPEHFPVSPGPEAHWPSKIVVPVDFSWFSLPVAEKAIGLCRESNGEVILLHVTEFAYGNIEGFPLTSFPVEEGRRALDGLVERVRKKSGAGVRVRSALRYGCASDQIARFAQEEKARLIVMGTHSRNVARFILGSVTEAVLRTTPCPLLVLHPEAREEREEILRPSQ